jgi:L-amino acid N-acyltransferase YncA
LEAEILVEKWKPRRERVYYSQGVLMDEEPMIIRKATEEDAEAIAKIYNWYILNTPITVETEPVSQNEMKRRILKKRLKYDWLVAVIGQEIVGYAYYGAFRERGAYNYTVESAIYIPLKSIGMGFGRILYSNLIESAKKCGYLEMVGLIALPNPGSVALHRKMGFHEVGVLRNVGYKFEKFINVGIWQLSLLKDSQ